MRFVANKNRITEIGLLSTVYHWEMSYRQSQVDAINVVSYDFLDLNRQMMELQCLVTSECGIGLYIGELKTYNGE